MTLTISKYQLSKQQHTITLNYTIGENLNHFSHLCRNFFPRIGMRFVKHEMVWLPWQPGPSNNISRSLDDSRYHGKTESIADNRFNMHLLSLIPKSGPLK